MLSILMIAALLLVLMAAVLMSWIPTPVYAMVAGQALTVPSILTTVVQTLAFMEDLALYVWIVMLCFIIMSMLIGWCE